MPNYISSWNGSIFTRTQVDENNNPILEYIQNEPINIQNNVVQLDKNPNEKRRVLIPNFKEVFDTDIINQGEFKVGYSQGLIWFNSNDKGKSVNATYYGESVQYLSSSRIIDGIDSEGNPNFVGLELQNMKTDLEKIKSDYDNATHTNMIIWDSWQYKALVDNITTFTIDANAFNPLIDEAFLYFKESDMSDATYLILNEAYTIDGATITLKDWVMKKDNVVYIKIGKSSKDLLPIGTDGAGIQNGTISEPKLSSDLIAKINKKIISNKYKFTSTLDNTNTFIINASVYNPQTDVIELYYRGLLMEEDVNYSINGINVILGFSLKSGQYINYRVFKSVGI